MGLPAIAWRSVHISGGLGAVLGTCLPELMWFTRVLWVAPGCLHSAAEVVLNVCWRPEGCCRWHQGACAVRQRLSCWRPAGQGARARPGLASFTRHLNVLCGGCCCCPLCCRPAVQSATRKCLALQYATRVRTIKNDVSKNEASKEVVRLKKQVRSCLGHAPPGSPAWQPAVWMWLILQTAHNFCPIVAAVEQNSAVVIMMVAMSLKDLSCGDMCLMDLC